jgi:hypothetical protein
MQVTFAEMIGALLSTGIVASVVYDSIARGDSTATTALVGATGVALGYWLRAKIQGSTPQSDPAPTPTPAPSPLPTPPTPGP